MLAGTRESRRRARGHGPGERSRDAAHACVLDPMQRLGTRRASALATLVAGAALLASCAQTAAAPEPQAGGWNPFVDVVLSGDDAAVLHNSFFASDVRGAERTVSIASYVTVEEEWEWTLSHCHRTLAARGTEVVTFTIGYDSLDGTGPIEFEVDVTPVSGRTWGTVAGADDLSFALQPLKTGR